MEERLRDIVQTAPLWWPWYKTRTGVQVWPLLHEFSHCCCYIHIFQICFTIYSAFTVCNIILLEKIICILQIHIFWRDSQFNWEPHTTLFTVWKQCSFAKQKHLMAGKNNWNSDIVRTVTALLSTYWTPLYLLVLVANQLFKGCFSHSQ